ncbi:MAG: class I SAM-dependent methyltransferase [Actinomycetota bacterium]|nr:class I SAM-dependent methyltransferase [Actinomycetota bacterium]
MGWRHDRGGYLGDGALLSRIAHFVFRGARRPVLRHRGYRFGRRETPPGDVTRVWPQAERATALTDYFESHTTGRGIWKWRHHFEIYERHLAKFVGTDVNIVEIGIYSGGSLDMWRHYFGGACRIHGIDIAEACRAYEADHVTISIGDQGQPSFWREFLRDHQPIDVVIDDGGHQPHQQIATLEALLPRMSRGGVYLCEDVVGVRNVFHDYIAGLARNLHAWNNPDRMQSRTVPSALQRMVASIHLYPYMVVIERSADPPQEFFAPRRGTEWQPF